jgi:hypothetical protein
MFASIRRHQKWLWGIIITLTIISFVILMDPSYSSRGGGGRGLDGKATVGRINDRNLTADELFAAYREARIRFRLYTGRWPGQDESSRQMFDDDREVQERLFLLEKLKELRVEVGEEAEAGWVTAVFRDRDTGKFSPEIYRRFVQELPRAGMAEADFRRFARHEAGIQHLVSLAGLTGSLITPREAEALCRHENEQAITEVVLFSASNHLASITATPDRLMTFYTNNASRYRVPERVQVSYVKFDTTNFIAEAEQMIGRITNLNQRLEQAYREIGPDSFRDPDGKLMSQESALVRLRSQEQERLATVLAQRRANEFAGQLNELYEKDPGQLDALERLAASNGLPAAITEPFTRYAGPAGLKVLDTFAEAAFTLATNQPMVLEPVVGEDAVYILGFKQRLPSENPPFETVRERVTADHRQVEATRLAQEAGRKFHAALTNGLAQQKTFEALCAEEKLTPIKLSPFSLNTRSVPELGGRVDLSLVKERAFALGPGQVSDFVLTRDGGLVIQLVSRQPMDEARLKAELPAFLEKTRQNHQRQALLEWSRKEMEQMRLTDLPSLNESRKRNQP